MTYLSLKLIFLFYFVHWWVIYLPCCLVKMDVKRRLVVSCGSFAAYLPHNIRLHATEICRHFPQA